MMQVILLQLVLATLARSYAIGTVMRYAGFEFGFEFGNNGKSHTLKDLAARREDKCWLVHRHRFGLQLGQK